MVKNGNSAIAPALMMENWEEGLKIVSAEQLRSDERLANVRAEAADWTRLGFYFVVLVTDGECVQSVDFHDYPLRRGDVLIVQPQQIHRFAILDGWHGQMLSFETTVLVPNQYIEIQKKFYIQFQGLPTCLHLSDDQFRQVATIFGQIAEHKHVADDELRKSLLRLHLYVFSTLLASFLQQESSPSSKSAQRLARFGRLLDEHYATQKSVAFYAEQLGCTEKTLSADCTAHWGKTAKAVIADRLILEAKRLLTFSHFPINQIGYQLGFSEPTNFVKFFKKHTGQTPLEFRQREWVG